MLIALYYHYASDLKKSSSEGGTAALAGAGGNAHPTEGTGALTMGDVPAARAAVDGRSAPSGGAPAGVVG